MICPKCGHEKTGVRSTQKVERDGELVILRYRKCAECSANFTTYECYELADCESSFDNAEMKETLKRVAVWLEVPARHIPIVRDARKLLKKHIS